MAGYVINTAAEQKEMLETLGLDSFDGLFADIPAGLRLKDLPGLPAPMTEPEVLAHMRALAAKNRTVEDCACFLGAGAYDHYIPTVVKSLLTREEFYTAYTPYQPEISQGTLQAIFEYQSMICSLTGMDAANASLYDGATALAEAAMTACSAAKRPGVLVSAAVNPQGMAVLKTYARFRSCRVETFGWANGMADFDDLAAKLTPDTAAIVLQTPNFFGVVEDIARAAELAHKNGSLLVVACDPVSLALLKPPGALGADIVVGEGQPLGGPLSFGGPYLGFFAVKEPLLRRMPGRVCGLTQDEDGRRSFVLTLQAREQHIRREKATSNICTNEALNALAATVYLAALGEKGLRAVAEQCVQKAHYAYRRLLETGAFEPMFEATFFLEFALRCRGDVASLNRALLQDGILGGYALEESFPALRGGWLVAVTEKRTRAEIDRLAERAAAK